MPVQPGHRMSRSRENLEQFAIDVILERRGGARAAVLRSFLYFLSLIYERLVQSRLFLYRKRILRERALGCLVISIGSLTVGGTGKTPIVEKFARALQKEDVMLPFLVVVTKVSRVRANAGCWQSYAATIPIRHGLSPMENPSCSIR